MCIRKIPKKKTLFSLQKNSKEEKEETIGYILEIVRDLFIMLLL